MFLSILKNSMLKTQQHTIMYGGHGRFLEIDIWTKKFHPKVWWQIWPGFGNHQTLIFLCFRQTLQVKASKLDFLSFRNSHYLTHSHTNAWKIRAFELKSINKKFMFYDGLKMRLFSESVGFWEFVQSTITKYHLFSHLTIFWFEENFKLSTKFWEILKTCIL